MVISHKLKTIFIHAHRTAGTTCSNILMRKSVGHLQLLTPHTNARTVKPQFFEQYADYFTFGFARNPWARMASWYFLIHFRDQKSVSEEKRRLEEFLEKDWALDFTTQYFHYNCLDYFTNKNGELVVDKIFHYENFDAEVALLLRQLHLSPIRIPVYNQSKVLSYKWYYTDKSRSLVAEKCKKDIQYFDYKF